MLVKRHHLDDKQIAFVCPITHQPPKDSNTGIQLSWRTRVRCGLDTKPSWIITSQTNRIEWPAHDVWTQQHEMPAQVFRSAKKSLLEFHSRGKLAIVNRGR